MSQFTIEQGQTFATQELESLKREDLRMVLMHFGGLDKLEVLDPQGNKVKGNIRKSFAMLSPAMITHIIEMQGGEGEEPAAKKRIAKPPKTPVKKVAKKTTGRVATPPKTPVGQKPNGQADPVAADEVPTDLLNNVGAMFQTLENLLMTAIDGQGAAITEVKEQLAELHEAVCGDAGVVNLANEAAQMAGRAMIYAKNACLITGGPEGLGMAEEEITEAESEEG